MQRERYAQEPLRAASGGHTRALRACSSCAGNYEDPERTAWPVDFEEVEADSEANGQSRIRVMDLAGNVDASDCQADTGAGDDEDDFPAL